MVVTRTELRIVVQMAYFNIYDAFLIPAQEIELVHIGGSAAVILKEGHMIVEKHLLFFLLFLIILVQRVLAERSLAFDAQYLVEIDSKIVVWNDGELNKISIADLKKPHDSYP